LVSLPSTAFADQQPERSNPAVVLVGGQYGSPTRLFGSAGLLIAPPKPLKPERRQIPAGSVCPSPAAGTGGVRGGVGLSALALEGPCLTTGFDALFTITRTGASRRDADPDATYAGFEAGLVLMSVRLNAGVAHRVSGAGTKDTIFTWGVGVQIPIGW
jgi:hypothetical protein